MPGQAYAPSMYWLRWAGENNWAVHLCTSPKVLDDRGPDFHCEMANLLARFIPTFHSEMTTRVD